MGLSSVAQREGTAFVVRCAPQATYGTSSIAVEGRLDRSSVTGFRFLLRDFVRDRAVAIDLSRCEAMDEVGAEALGAALREIRSAGVDAWVSDVHEGIEDTLAIAGLAWARVREDPMARSVAAPAAVARTLSTSAHPAAPR